MSQLPISEVARQVGLRSSAIRYYEQIGILPPARRVNGRRRYDSSVLYRLAVVQRARQSGFTLDEIRNLFFGFGDAVPASRRWKTLSKQKLAELTAQMNDIKTMQGLLRRMMDKCQCDTLERCGRAICQRAYAGSGTKSLSKMSESARR